MITLVRFEGGMNKLFDVTVDVNIQDLWEEFIKKFPVIRSNSSSLDIEEYPRKFSKVMWDLNDAGYKGHNIDDIFISWLEIEHSAKSLQFNDIFI